MESNPIDETIYNAVRTGDVQTLRLLLATSGVDINNTVECRYGYGNSPLLLSVRQNWLEIIFLLLTSGATTDDFDTHTLALVVLLYLAVNKGSLAWAKVLLEQGAKVDDTARIPSPLYPAAVDGRLDIVQLLLTHGAKIDVATSNGVTPIHRAINTGHGEIAKLLLHVQYGHYGIPINPSNLVDYNEIRRYLQPQVQHADRTCVLDRVKRARTDQLLGIAGFSFNAEQRVWTKVSIGTNWLERLPGEIIEMIARLSVSGDTVVPYTQGMDCCASLQHRIFIND